MQGRTKSPLVIFLVLGLIVGHSAASLSDLPLCFLGCFVPCVLFSGALSCAVKCLTQCILPINGSQDPQSASTLQCAISRCANISTKEDPAVEKVKECVDGCAKDCS